VRERAGARESNGDSVEGGPGGGVEGGWCENEAHILKTLTQPMSTERTSEPVIAATNGR